MDPSSYLLEDFFVPLQCGHHEEIQDKPAISTNCKTSSSVPQETKIMKEEEHQIGNMFWNEVIQKQNEKGMQAVNPQEAVYKEYNETE
eukprot:7582148-Ditylum_brightwellii.AAC.1